MSTVTSRAVTALRGLPEIERQAILVMLDDNSTYAALGDQLGIGAEEAQRTFAAALVHLADALDALPPGTVVDRFPRRIGAVARLARRSGRR